MDKYLANFAAMRMIQDHLEALARTMGVPVIAGDNIDKAIEKALEVITSRFHDLFERENKEMKA